jgi:hypothetical protein
VLRTQSIGIYNHMWTAMCSSHNHIHCSLCAHAALVQCRAKNHRCECQRQGMKILGIVEICYQTVSYGTHRQLKWWDWVAAYTCTSGSCASNSLWLWLAEAQLRSSNLVGSSRVHHWGLACMLVTITDGNHMRATAYCPQPLSVHSTIHFLHLIYPQQCLHCKRQSNNYRIRVHSVYFCLQ